jgi:hypothetical protein
MNLSLKQKHSTFLQDSAAGGIENRKIKIKSGDIVTASISITGEKSPFKSTLRFKSGGTVQRPFESVEAKDKNEALKLSWQKVRNSKFIENQGWEWIHK